jgi:tRNA-(ms[2]io[6]A)-hydroxylase
MKMSKLAREELRHFEQVLSFMKKYSVDYEKVSAARYASSLHEQVRTHEPARLVDSLIIGAIIEARSCERFAALAPLLDDELKDFYLSLLKSESRHYRDYLSLAKKYADEPIEVRLDEFLEMEKQLIQGADKEFRFHSGSPE